MHVSNSSLTIFKDCPYKYYLNHILKLQPKKKSWALIDGEVLHKCLEALYRQDPIIYTEVSPLMKKCLQIGVPAHLEGILSLVEHYYDKLEEDPDTVDFHRYLTMAMVSGYLILYQNDKVTGYQPELTGTIKINADGKQTELEFRADALVTIPNGNIIKEYKTSSEWSLPRFIERLLLDWQPSCYMYGFTKLGYDPMGVMYDIIRKPRLKQGSVESNEAFNFRIVKAMIYDSLKGGKEYYHREFITRSEQDIREYEEDLKRIIKDLTTHIEQELWYKNSGRCNDYNGCPFKILCWESDLGKKQELIEEFFKEGLND